MPLCGNPAVMTTHLVVPSQSPVGWFLDSFVGGESGFMSERMGVGVLAYSVKEHRLIHSIEGSVEEYITTFVVVGKMNGLKAEAFFVFLLFLLHSFLLF